MLGLLLGSVVAWSCHGQVLRTTADAAEQSAVSNMNGDYLLSQTPGAHDTQSRFPTQYKDFPRHVQSFDVYSPPITSIYSQVFWKALPPVDLPKDIVAAFHGKGMAVVGFEVDQVRRTAEGDVSVPLTVAYNHHFESTMVGTGAHFEKVVFQGPDDPRLLEMLSESMGHGMPSDKEHWMVHYDDVNGSPSQSALPKKQAFGAGNGGEYRKSFHGFAPGYVQVIQSPTQFQITPMQIDTWNRDKMNLTYPATFVAGPLPRTSLAPANATYSGLLECPVTTRIQKLLDTQVRVQQGLCEQPITSAADCQHSAELLLKGSSVQVQPVVSVADPKAPAGCSIRSSTSSAWRAEPYLNSLSAGAESCGEGAERFIGAAKSLVTVSVDINATEDQVLLNLTGPADVWFGVGFNASAMANLPWTIVVEGDGTVSERKLADHSPGELLTPSVKVLSSSTASGRRTVVLSRPLKGPSTKHYSFDPKAGPTLRFINALGNVPTLSQHKIAEASSLALLPVGTAGGDCICRIQQPFGTVKGSLQYQATNQSVDVGSGSVRFGNTCPPEPRGDLLTMKNPTCDLRSYVGGQVACHHMWSLLDADQPIPWADQPLTYHLKFRFWVQEYNSSYHKQVTRQTWGLASPVEYDVPKCSPGTKGCEQQPDGNWIHTITGTFQAKGQLVAAHFHCHAPTCLSVSLYRCPAGTKVCNASTGQLLCREEPVYGKDAKTKFEEPGYILQPPCLWGSAQYGLEDAPELTGHVLGGVKTANATYGHHGEMAWLQVFTIPSKEMQHASRESILV